MTGHTPPGAPQPAGGDGNVEPGRNAQIQARLEAATPGPWFRESDGVYNATRSYLVTPTGDSWQDTVDAEFIANAPADVAWLLAEVDRLTKLGDALADALTLLRHWTEAAHPPWDPWGEVADALAAWDAHLAAHFPDAEQEPEG